MNTRYPELSFSLIDIKGSLFNDSIELTRAYTFWKKLWSSTLRELDGTESIHSDDFVRNDFIGLLNYMNTPIACCCYSVRDLSKPFTIDDSFFAAWPRELLVRFRNENNIGMIAAPSYLAIAPEWRKSQCQLPLKEILLAFLVKFLIDTRADATLTTPRADKGMSRLLQTMCHFRPLHTGVIYHNVPVDLVALLRAEALALHFGPLNDEINRLWEGRMPHPSIKNPAATITRSAS